MNGYITRVADEIADILLGEGIDYVQSKAVFRTARIKAGLHAPKETRNAPARLTLEEQLRFRGCCRLHGLHDRKLRATRWLHQD